MNNVNSAPDSNLNESGNKNSSIPQKTTIFSVFIFAIIFILGITFFFSEWLPARASQTQMRESLTENYHEQLEAVQNQAPELFN